jgi:hypothetical protein
MTFFPSSIVLSPHFPLRNSFLFKNSSLFSISLNFPLQIRVGELFLSNYVCNAYEGRFKNQHIPRPLSSRRREGKGREGKRREEIEIEEKRFRE